MTRLDDAVHDLMSAGPPPPDLDRLRRRAGRRPRTFAAVAGVLVAAVLIIAALAIAGSRHPHESVVVAPSANIHYENVPPRYGAAIAYDAARREVVLFGGEHSTGTLNDTWLWNGHGWSEMHPSVAPPPRANAVMAYDPDTKDVVLFGGTQDVHLANSIAHRDTWTWDGTTWTQQHPLHQPPWNNGLAMSYDPRSHSILLLTLPSKHPGLTSSPNGGGAKGAAPFGTWRWDGSDWHELKTPVAPLAVTSAFAFHTDPRLTALPHGAGLLLYSWAVYDGSCPAGAGGCGTRPDPTGTRDSQTWTWDGSHWTEQHPRNAPVAGQLVVTPGIDADPTVFAPDGTTWRWTGSDWQETAAQKPAPTQGGAAVYDEANNDVVAYAGDVFSTGEKVVDLFDTWTWSGRWTERPPTTRVTTTSPSTTTTPAPTTSCTAGQLRARGSWEGESGGLHGDLEFTNTSGSDCSLDVRGASALLTTQRAPIPLQPQSAGAGRDFTPRVLPSNGSTDVLIFWSNWCNPNPGALHALLTLPNGRGTVVIAFGGATGDKLVPRCDSPNSPSTIEILGFAAT